MYRTRKMDIILSAITPIITTGIEKSIVPIIEDNLTKLDEIEVEINTKIDELTGQVKHEIDNIPVFPFGFTDVMKAELLAKLPFEKVDEALDKIDLSAIEKIPIPSDADGKIKEKLTQFPEKIKSKLKSSIRTAFSAGSNEASTTVVDAKDAGADKDPAAAEAPAGADKAPAATDAKATGPEATADKDLKITSEEAANILNDLKKTLGPNVFDALIAAAGDIKAQQGSKGVSEANGDEAGESNGDKAGESEGVKTVVPNGDKAGESEGDKAGPEGDKAGPEGVAVVPKGGAKKRRRKTKKNIRRPKKSYTKFGRKF